MTTKKIIAEIYHTLKISAATFSLVAGLGVTSLYAQSGGPVPPCADQYTVVGAAYTCPTTSMTGTIVDANCNTISGGGTYIGNTLCVRVTPPSAATNWQTQFEITKRDGTNFRDAGRILIYDNSTVSVTCFPFAAGGTKKVINYNQGIGAENNTYYVYLQSNTTERFFGGSFVVRNNPHVCKIAPFNGETGVSISPTLSYNTLNVLGSNLWRYALKYRKLGEATWGYTSFTSNASATLSNLPQGTTYEWTVISRWGSSNTWYEGEIFQFTTTSPAPPPPCYPEVEYLGELAWNTTLAEYTVLSCNDIIDYIENTDDPFWITSVQYNAATGKVEVGMQANNTLEYRYATLKIYTTAGKRWVWQVQQKPMEYQDIEINLLGNGIVCETSFVQQLSSNALLDNYHYVMIFAEVLKNNGNAGIETILVGEAPAADAIANGVTCTLPVNMNSYGFNLATRAMLFQTLGGVPTGSPLVTSEGTYRYAGNPYPVNSHQVTLEACENGLYQCYFGSNNTNTNIEYIVKDEKDEVVAVTDYYFVKPVGGTPETFSVVARDKDCDKYSQPYSFTITPIAKPIVEIIVNGNQHIVNQPITVNFSGNQSQHPNTPPITYVSFNNGAFSEISPAIVNGSFNYTPTQIGNYVFRIQYRGNLGCWGATVSDEITVSDVVIPIGNDIYVNATTGNDVSGNGTLLSPYKTLAKGLSVITVGSALNFAGNFNEAISINKNITLIGDGENTSSIGTLRIVAGQEVSVLGNFGITDKLEIENGALLSCVGNSIWLKSDATKTATAQIEGTLDGEIAAERYLPSIYAGALFGSPIADQVITDLPFASPPKEFKENSVTTSLNAGYVPTTDLSSVAAKGYRVFYVAATQKVIVFGTPNNDVAYSQLISRTHTGIGSAGGYNLLSNSYLMPLSFNSIHQANAGQINGILYFFQGTSPTAGIFRTYNAITGVSTGGATNTIATFQGFFVRRTVVGTSNFVIGKNNWLSNANNSQYFRAENARKMDLLRVLVKSGRDSSDLAIHTWKATSSRYEAGLDQELPNVDEFVASNLVWMYEKESGENLLVNAIGEELKGEFPLTINAKGETAISFPELPNNTKIALYDKLTGEKLEVGAGFEYKFQSSGKQNDRFVLLLGDTVDDYMLDNQLVVYPNPANGEVTISTKTLQGFENLVRFSELQILDMLGREVYKNSNFEKTISLDTKNFAAGIYLVKVSGNGKVMTKKLVIQ